MCGIGLPGCSLALSGLLVASELHRGQCVPVVPGYGRYRACVTGYAKQIQIGRSAAVYFIRVLHQPQAIAA